MTKDVKWYQRNGNDDAVVVSSRIRLARNIERYPFPCRMTKEQKKEVVDLVRQAAHHCSAHGLRLDFLELDQCTQAQLVSLVERHLVSPNFIQDLSGKAVAIAKDESVSIMVNEEDHIRIQVLCPGLELDKALATAVQVDELIGGSIRYAFDEKLGFLTQCPTNLGTGLRASVMMHLMGLEQLSLIARLASTISKMGLTIRGTFGEGTKAKHYYYQVSNQITLGIDEKQVVENLRQIAGQIIGQELRAQKQLLQEPAAAENKIFRVLGMMKYATMLTYDELCNFVSDLRLGVCQKMLDIPPHILGAMVTDTSQANLLVRENGDLTAAQRDILRAALVKEYLQDY